MDTIRGVHGLNSVAEARCHCMCTLTGDTGPGTRGIEKEAMNLTPANNKV